MVTDLFDLTCAWFNSEPEIARYRAAQALQPAEEAIVKYLRHLLPRMDVLDVGVGGRTTRHVAPVVRRYIGIDIGEFHRVLRPGDISPSQVTISFSCPAWRAPSDRRCGAGFGRPSNP